MRNSANSLHAAFCVDRLNTLTPFYNYGWTLLQSWEFTQNKSFSPFKAQKEKFVYEINSEDWAEAFRILNINGNS